MQDFLTKGIDENGNIRSEETHQFKDSPLGRIPVEWDCNVLNDETNIIDCKHITPSYVEEGFPIIRPRNIKIDGLDLSDIDYVNEKDYQFLTEKHKPRKGDIIFSRNASFGIPVFIDIDIKLCIGQDVIILTKKQTDTKFIYYSLLEDYITRQINIVSGGSTFGRIDLGAIRKLKVKIPKNYEQKRIVKLLDNTFNQINHYKTIRLKLSSLKTALMQDLLTGKVRVTKLLKEEYSSKMADS